MIEHKLIRCEPTDPNRCQARGDRGEGQCCFLSVEGFKNCPKHSGLFQAGLAEKKKLHDYRLQQWQIRIDEFSASETVRSLRGEIGILRLQVEEIMNLCKTNMDLMLYSSKISDLVMKIERLVTSCSKIEDRQGNLLDKSAALILAGQIVDSISKHVDSAETVDKISKDIIDLVAKLAGKEQEDDS